MITITQLCKVHGLLRFNEIEEEIIRHPEFNRLADVKQLGYAYKGAYKGATHTRLAHALGTCHVAREILLNTIGKNRTLLKKYPKSKILLSADELDEMEENINALSVAALLHDINHTPYAHAIENHFEYFEIINSSEKFEENINKFHDCELFNDELRNIVKSILIPKNHKDFKYAEIFRKIIRGDLGASTIDFIVRDHLETGFERIGIFRLYESFLLINYQGKIKLALDIQESTDPLTLVYHLLFNRFKLSQRVYFHKTCASAEAMIGKALRKIYKLHQESPDIHESLEDFLKIQNTDDRFIYALGKYNDPEVRHLGGKLLTRLIYDSAFKIKWSNDNKPIRDYLCGKFRREENIDNCIKLEEIIADEVGVEPKNISIFCYNDSMYQFNVQDLSLVNEGLKISSFPFSGFVERDAVESLKKLHEKLWKFYVFCDKTANNKKDSDTINKIAEFCKINFKDVKSLSSLFKRYNEISKNKSRPKRVSDKNVKKVFIAYARKEPDKNHEQLYKMLKSWEYLPYIDTVKSNPGDEWDKDVENNLSDCDLVIILWSKYAEKSENIKDEINAAKKLKKQKFALILDETELPLLHGRIDAVPFQKTNPNRWNELKDRIDRTFK